MRKYYLFCLFVLAGYGTVAQVRIGLKAGAHSTTARVVTPGGGKPEVDNTVGFHGGLALKMKIEGQLYFVPQMQYAYKGFVIHYNNTDTVSNSLKVHYLEIPLLFEWKKENYKSGLFLQFGPSFSVAMSGNQKIEGKTGTTVSKPIKYGFNAYGRAEANLVGNIGYQFGKKLQLTVGYAHGLGTIIDDDFGPVIKPRMFTGSLVYWLH
jgi:hypothetical protein